MLRFVSEKDFHLVVNDQIGTPTNTVDLEERFNAYYGFIFPIYILKNLFLVKILLL